MDGNSIIDKENYEVYKFAEDYPKAILCDRRLAPVIATLNKKGYKTKASCSGHYKEGCKEFFKADLKDLEEAKNNNQVFIREIRVDSFDYYMEYRDTVIYILFEKRYNFDCVPEEFTLIQFEDDESSLEHKVEFFDENNHKKTRLEIELELDKYCEILNKWAEKLPDNN